MDQLWSPWRFQYVSNTVKSDQCVFCASAEDDASHDREHLLLHRGRLNFVLLNRFPYTTGHAMVAPYAHSGNFEDLNQETLAEMMELARRFLVALKDCYRPEGYNLGMNLGRCAGAGIVDHLHFHILPRWTGDSNFMTVVGGTRVQPEDLLVTYDKLARHFPHRG